MSVFALTVDDAFAALAAMAGADPRDAYSRALPLGRADALAPGLRIGVPRPADRLFFGDARAQGAFDLTLRALARMGYDPIEIDLTPFLDTARLLYEGPWVAERFAAVGAFIAAHPNEVHPVTRSIIAAGETPSAVDAFRAFYRLAELARGDARNLGADRRARRSDRARRLYGGRNRGRSDPAQFAARHLHEFRQPARSRRHRGSREQSPTTARRSA